MILQRYAVEYWIEKGADRNKLLLGLAPYGRTFTLTDPKERGLYAKNSGAGTAGPYTGEPGYMNYNEVSPKHGRLYYEGS